MNPEQRSDPVNEVPECKLVPARAELVIETTFAAQRETAIALRTSTAAMRIEKLKGLRPRS